MGIRVLLIEDDQRIADPLVEGLGAYGLSVRHVRTGAEGVRGPFGDVVLLDLGLPDLDGVDVCRRIRAVSPVPIVIISARDGETDRVLGLELGADDYVAKPFSPRELVARVRTILRRAGRQEQPRAPDAPPPPFQVDEGRRQIRYYGHALELSRYEYGLLKTLVARPGHVYTRDALLELVWDDPGESLDRTVDAHVKTLRAKLRAVAPHLDPIRTHRGAGYALAEDLPATLAP